MSRKGWIILIVCSAVLAAAWFAVFATYKVDGTSENNTAEVTVPENGVLVLMEPLSFAPGDNQMKVRLQFEPQGNLSNPADGSLTKDVIVAVSSDAGITEVLLQKGRQPSATEVSLGTQGNYATYPFDKYRAETQIIADQVTRDVGGQVTAKDSLEVSVQTAGAVDAWNLNGNVPTNQPAEVVDANFDLQRSGNTLLFTFFLLALMTVLVLLAVIVAVLTYSNRRHIEVDLLGWFAGLLFALPFLRSIFPGAPPVGAAIDVYVFLWLLGLAMAAAVLVVIGWLGQNKAELLKESYESGVHDGLLENSKAAAGSAADGSTGDPAGPANSG